MDTVTVVIPTLDRPAALRRAVESVLRQAGPADVAIDVVVVDNSMNGNAQSVVASIPAAANIPVQWRNEPCPGVANARNAGVRAATGDWIAFLDDDEEADAHWIAALVAVAKQGGADAVFGPIEPRADGDGEIEPIARYFQRRIDRPDGADITVLSAYLGTNNSMFNRARCLVEPAPFDPRLNTSGGEDSLLLKRLVMEGRRFAWASRAHVIEWVPQRRLTMNYVLKRKFLSGQIRVFVLRMAHPPQWTHIALWMAVGAVQSLVGGAATLALRPFGGPAYDRASVIFFAGLGKLFWAPRFRPALYGAGLVS
jgi:succinoglycan biosynthesis protein ExoM